MARTIRTIGIMALLALLSVETAQAANLGQVCHFRKLKAAATYGACRLQTEANVVAGKTVDATKCFRKYDSTWIQIERNGGSACVTTGDETDIQGALDLAIDNIIGGLNTQGSLVDYVSDLTTCVSSLSTCDAERTMCFSDLAACEAEPRGVLRKTGQTTCFDSDGLPTSCGGTGHDGDLKKGLARQYQDNGDGTITDLTSGLMWEKKTALNGVTDSSPAGLHDADNTYTWASTFTDFIGGLNLLNAGLGFAGHNDWRMPNRAELESLLNLGLANPAIDPVFANTQSNGYWSSSTYIDAQQNGWVVDFQDGHVGFSFKTAIHYVRAVRGGS